MCILQCSAEGVDERQPEAVSPFRFSLYRHHPGTCTPFFLYLRRFYKKAAAFVLRAVAKHSPDLAQAVVDSGALDALVPCLEVHLLHTDDTYICTLVPVALGVRSWLGVLFEVPLLEYLSPCFGLCKKRRGFCLQDSVALMMSFGTAAIRSHHFYFYFRFSIAGARLLSVDVHRNR